MRPLTTEYGVQIGSQRTNTDATKKQASTKLHAKRHAPKQMSPPFLFSCIFLKSVEAKKRPGFFASL